MKSINLYSILSIGFIALALASCAGHNDTGLEFAPNMYDNLAYEPMSQISKNTINAHGMTMREPVKGTVARGNFNSKFSSDSAAVHNMFDYSFLNQNNIAEAEGLKNPIPWSQATEDEGKVLYERNCMHCHGEKGMGDGKVAAKYKGVPVYSSDALRNLTEGHIFHVISFGIRRMWPHKAQVTPEERWKIIHYVHKLQQGS